MASNQCIAAGVEMNICFLVGGQRLRWRPTHASNDSVNVATSAWVLLSADDKSAAICSPMSLIMGMFSSGDTNTSLNVSTTDDLSETSCTKGRCLLLLLSFRQKQIKTRGV